MMMVVMAPPWYSSVLTVYFSLLPEISPWTGCHQVKTGGGSPRHLICQKAVLLVLTVWEPAWPLSIQGATETPAVTSGLYNTTLTVLVSAEVGFGLRRWVGLSCLVDGDHSELVPLAFTQPGHASLQLVDGRHTVLVVGDEGIEPAAELVFLLDDVVADGAAAVTLGLLPPECDGLVVEVDNLWFTRLAGRSCNTEVTRGSDWWGY